MLRLLNYYIYKLISCFSFQTSMTRLCFIDRNLSFRKSLQRSKELICTTTISLKYDTIHRQATKWSEGGRRCFPLPSTPVDNTGSLFLSQSSQQIDASPLLGTDSPATRFDRQQRDLSPERALDRGKTSDSTPEFKQVIYPESFTVMIRLNHFLETIVATFGGWSDTLIKSFPRFSSALLFALRLLTRKFDKRLIKIPKIVQMLDRTMKLFPEWQNIARNKTARNELALSSAVNLPRLYEAYSTTNSIKEKALIIILMYIYVWAT